MQDRADGWSSGDDGDGSIIQGQACTLRSEVEAGEPCGGDGAADPAAGHRVYRREADLLDGEDMVDPAAGGELASVQLKSRPTVHPP